MRSSSPAIGLMGLLVLGLTICARSVDGKAKGYRHSEDSGCMFVVVRDSVTGKPLDYTNCTAPYFMNLGCQTDSLGDCLLCRLPTGKVVLTFQRLGYGRRGDTVRVIRGRTDTLRVMLGVQRLAPSETLDTGAKY